MFVDGAWAAAGSSKTFAGEDATRAEGRLPNSCSADKRIRLVPAVRGVVGSITPRNRPETMPAGLIPPALVRGSCAAPMPAP